MHETTPTPREKGPALRGSQGAPAAPPPARRKHRQASGTHHRSHRTPFPSIPFTQRKAQLRFKPWNQPQGHTARGLPWRRWGSGPWAGKGARSCLPGRASKASSRGLPGRGEPRPCTCRLLPSYTPSPEGSCRGPVEHNRPAGGGWARTASACLTPSPLQTANTWQIPLGSLGGPAALSPRV